MIQSRPVPTMAAAEKMLVSVGSSGAAKPLGISD
jgi:hypothetical protein